MLVGVLLLDTDFNGLLQSKNVCYNVLTVSLVAVLCVVNIILNISGKKLIIC